MLTKSTIALSVALTLSAAPVALADYNYGPAGAPVGPYAVETSWNVPALEDIYASAAPRASVPQARATIHFNSNEKALFDRQSWSGYEGQ
jgi:hypothetical protein